ncbi:MAG TPA: aldo/keto reductase [Gemmatimonadaceae bacterium]
MNDRTTQAPAPSAPLVPMGPVSAPTSPAVPAGAAQRATPAGTAAYEGGRAPRLAPDFFRTMAGGLRASGIGLGTYLGADTDADDHRYTMAIRAAVDGGINVIDTAVNYRCQRSERAVGRALQLLLARDGALTRDQFVVSTKGGYVPLEDCPPATAEGYQGYLRREFFAPRMLSPAELVGGGHSLAPAFIADCLRRSRENLGLGTIDLYYVHNPEQQLPTVPYDELLGRVRAVFELLEEKVSAGEIGSYGVATWNGLRVPPGTRGHLSLVDLVRLAREVAGEGHHFTTVQLPVNLAMPEGFRLGTQAMAGDAGGEHLLPAVQAAAELGLDVVASASLAQGRLADGLPPTIRELFPALETDAQRAAAFVRSLPGVTVALVGMKELAHVEEQVRGARIGGSGGR